MSPGMGYVWSELNMLVRKKNDLILFWYPSNKSKNPWNFQVKMAYYNHLKGVYAKNERGYRLRCDKKALLIATDLTSLCCVYKEKIVKDVSYRIT